MSISRKKDFLSKNIVEDEKFSTAIIFYKTEGLSLEQVLQKIENKYTVSGYYFDVIEHIYNHA